MNINRQDLISGGSEVTSELWLAATLHSLQVAIYLLSAIQPTLHDVS